MSLEIEVGRLALSVFFMAALITALAKFSERSKNGKCVRKKFSNSGVGVLYNFKSDLETRTRFMQLIYYLLPLLDGALNGEDEEVTSGQGRLVVDSRRSSGKVDLWPRLGGRDDDLCLDDFLRSYDA